MSVAKVIEISADSNESFEDALRRGIKKASKTIENIRGAWIADHEVVVKNGEIETYRVRARLTFVLED